LAFSAFAPPWRYSVTQRVTVGRVTPKTLGRLGVGHALQDRVDGPPPEIPLGCGGQRTRIGGCHARRVPQLAFYAIC
jgi:hypothetical protein